MQGIRHHLLARTGLAEHEHVDIGLGHLAHQASQPHDLRRNAQEGRIRLDRSVEAGAQPPILVGEPAPVERAPDGGHEGIGRIGLGQEIVGAVAHGADRHPDVAVAGDQDDGQVRIGTGDALEQAEPVEIRQAHVADDDAGRIGENCRERRLGGGKHLDGEPVELQALPVGPADILLVVDEDDALRPILRRLA
ncbi:hypothetical protein AEGHOMDF_5462 [Methylobacterium soli]|nr:hypothetical protein AEGHOMDF_5462 [Methylobacterium soli]